MTIEQHKAIGRRLIEEFVNGGNLAVVDEVFASDFVNHPAPAAGGDHREAVKQIIVAGRAAFPDLHATIAHLVAEGDCLVLHVRVSGTHHGEFLGVAPTGKHGTGWDSIAILRFADGKVVERWNAMDALGILQQLGATVTTGPPAR
jgi:predicted ester cyclase